MGVCSICLREVLAHNGIGINVHLWQTPRLVLCSCHSVRVSKEYIVNSAKCFLTYMLGSRKSWGPRLF